MVETPWRFCRQHAVLVNYRRNRLSAYDIRFTSRCSMILHPNLPPQGALGALRGILGEDRKTGNKRFTKGESFPTGCLSSINRGDLR